MKKGVFAALFISSALFGYAQDEKKGIEKVLGEKSLPSVELADMNGNKVNVAELSKSGHPVVLSFWATWCVPCKKELSNLADLYEEWKDKYHVEIVAVSIDDSRSTTKVKPYVDGQHWEYKVLLDVNQDLKRSLNIQTVPFTVMTDANGKIVYTHSGYVEGDEYVLEEELQKLAKLK